MAKEKTDFKDLKLWYKEPAVDDDKGSTEGPETYEAHSQGFVGWEEYALPIGNGYLGAMIFGGTEKERIQLTENTLSTPDEGLTNFAETYIDFNHDYALVTNYHRELDLNTACVTVCYTYEGVDYKREYIASYPDKVLAIKFSASEKGKLNFTLKPQIPYLSETPPVKSGEVKKDNEDIVLSGLFGEWNIKYEGNFRVITCGGEKSFVNNCGNAAIEIKNADSAEIFIAIGTNYPMKKTSVYFGEDRLREGTGPHEKLKDAIEKATEKGYDEIRGAQLTDYQKYFDRVHLDLGEDMPKIPTDMLVKEYSEGKLSTYLEVLMFQYGRYLLISSSREGAMPANLQGLWNRYKKGICKVGYWHNINTQMNYWPTFVTNLTEMYKCYTDYFDTLVPNVKTQSAEIIKEHVLENYDENGDNGWNISTGMTPFFSYVIYGGGYSGNVCGAFTCETFWDYYLFTKDKELLKNWVYPMLYGNANYMSRIVVKQKDGLYLTENSGSPENHVDFTPKGTFFDQMMTYDVMRHTLEAAKILGIDESSDENLKRIRERVDKLSPVAIGTSGQIKEFREETYYSEFGEKEHRHISHLAGVYPGTVIDSNTPSWLDSVQTTLDLRGDFGSGWAWAMAHRACVWARTKNSCRTYDLIKRQLGTRTWKNLFAAQIAFQIEGNFGYSSAIAEMLVQSHEGYIDILPTIPENWKSGSFSGLKARGAFEIGVEWTDGKAEKISITSQKGGTCRIHYPGIKNAVVMTSNSGVLQCETENDDTINFETISGETYEIINIPFVPCAECVSCFKAEVKEKTVKLSWKKAEDTAYCKVYMAKNGEAEYTEVAKTEEEEFTFNNALNENDRITYAVTSVNYTGRESKRVWVYANGND